MKKLLLSATALALGLLATAPAFAHHGHSSGGSRGSTGHMSTVRSYTPSTVSSFHSSTTKSLTISKTSLPSRVQLSGYRKYNGGTNRLLSASFKSFSYRHWNRRFGCYLYWYGSCNCWYYYCGPCGCYLPFEDIGSYPPGGNFAPPELTAGLPPVLPGGTDGLPPGPPPPPPGPGTDGPGSPPPVPDDLPPGPGAGGPVVPGGPPPVPGPGR